MAFWLMWRTWRTFGTTCPRDATIPRLLSNTEAAFEISQLGFLGWRPQAQKPSHADGVGWGHLKVLMGILSSTEPGPTLRPWPRSVSYCTSEMLFASWCGATRQIALSMRLIKGLDTQRVDRMEGQTAQADSHKPTPGVRTSVATS